MTLDEDPISQDARAARGSAGEVLRVFLKLGLTSFGGPVAHLAYFRDELVVRRRWIGESSYADLVALCQFLPGPASSQVGFALGLLRGGPWGALAAWAAFTLPSALLLLVFGLVAGSMSGVLGTGLLHGLKIVAVAVVAQAVWGMARTITPDRQRISIALGALMIVVGAGSAVGQIAAILFGTVAGLLFCRDLAVTRRGQLGFGVSRGVGLACLAAFLLLLAGLPLVATWSGLHAVSVFDAFYRSASLVFGGGHVVLPLLQAEVVGPGWVSNDVFLAGYGAAQAVPGPLFTFAAYLGTVMQAFPNGVAGALLCLLAIFLPGFLLLLGALPFWDDFRQRPLAQAAMRGANAAVVGLLAGALYNPVWTSAVFNARDFALAVTGMVLLMAWRLPPLAVVVILALGGVLLQLL